MLKQKKTKKFVRVLAKWLFQTKKIKQVFGRQTGVAFAW